MEINQMIEGIAQKQAEFVEKNTAEVEGIKSQLQELAETKSALQTANETIESIKSEIAQIKADDAKGRFSMTTQSNTEFKFSDYVSALSDGIREGKRGEAKSILNSQDPAMSLMFLPAYSNEVVERLRDLSPIFQYAVPKTVSGVNDETMIKIQLKDGSDIRSGVDENKEGAIITHTGTGEFGDYKPTWTKLESLLELTDEFVKDGQIDVSALVNSVPDLISRKAAYIALHGDSKMKGLLSMFKSALPDAQRPYNEFQYIDAQKGFGTDYDATVATFQAMFRSMPLAYRKKGLPIVISEGTFDLITRNCNKNGQPLITDLYTDGYDGRIMGKNVIIDPLMPEMDQPGSIFAMFGDFSSAVQFYTIEGQHVVNESAKHAGNTHVYDSVRMGLRMNDNFALKGLRVAAK